MITDELIALSKRVAEKLGIDASRFTHEHRGTLWLYEDSARCFELMCEHKLAVVPTEIDDASCIEITNTEGKFHGVIEYIKDHNDNLDQATRVAILKVLEAL